MLTVVQRDPLPLSPRPMVLTFDYRQRLSLRKYQDCGRPLHNLSASSLLPLSSRHHKTGRAGFVLPVPIVGRLTLPTLLL